MQKSSRIIGTVILLLLVMTAVFWCALWSESRSGKLTVSFLNIGQGDAIFIRAPSGRQVLIDGGPDRSVLRELSQVMPWYDRSIDVVVVTETTTTHVSGLLDVLQRYSVNTIAHSSTLATGNIGHLFGNAIVQAAAKGTRVLILRRGHVIDLGGGAYLQILSPDRLVPNVDANTGCLVMRLVYGKTSFMLPCDAPQAIEAYLVALDGAALKSDVLKVGAGGAKTSSSQAFIGFVDPTYAVYSRSCVSKIVLPAPETVATLAQFGIITKDICTDGRVTFESNGDTVRLK